MIFNKSPPVFYRLFSRGATLRKPFRFVSNLKKKYKSALVFTDKGRFVAEKVAGKVDRILDIAGNGLTEEKRTVLYESLRLISDNLENLCNNYKGEK